MATLEQIQAKLQKLQAQADALVAKNSSAVIEKIRELMAQHGLSTADIEAHTGPAKGGRKACRASKHDVQEIGWQESGTNCKEDCGQEGIDDAGCCRQ